MSKNSLDITSIQSFVLTTNEEYLKLLFNVFQEESLPLPEIVKGRKALSIDAKVKACMQGHINIIQKAKDLDLPYVLVLEEDAYPCKNAAEIFNNLELPYTWDVIKLGVTSVNTAPPHISPLIIPIGYDDWGSHAYIIHRRFYDKFLEYAGTYKYAADEVLSNTHNSFFVMPDLFCQVKIKDTDRMHNPQQKISSDSKLSCCRAHSICELDNQFIRS